MPKAKRDSDVFTRSTRRTRRAWNSQWVSGHFLEDSTQDVWAGLSDEIKSYLSKSVASITLCNGDTRLFSCSGIAMDLGFNLVRFLTSASLVKAMDGAKKDHDELEIEVRHEGDEVYKGSLEEYDLDRNFAVVDVFDAVDVQVGSFQHALEILPYDELLVAVGRSVSGEIVTKTVELRRDLGISEDDEDLNSKTSQAWEGGPLLFVDHIVGMNLFLTRRRAIFQPLNIILKHGLGARPMGGKSITYPHTVQGYYFKQELLDLDAMGYPKLPSSMLRAGMILVNTFEETFGDIRRQGDEGVWRKFDKRYPTINRNVVALASFDGFFIEWTGSPIILTSASLVRNSGYENEIVKNLRIEVLLPNNKHTEGTLQHYSLHYNVALVSVKDCPRRLLKTLPNWPKHLGLAAVGRCFKSGALMATSGDLVNWTGTLDCRYLIRSTCKITKAGIGGPLVTLEGDVIGMNFYDKRVGTPFLSWQSIDKILKPFKEKSEPSEEVGNNSDPSTARFWKMDGDGKEVLNRWPVPVPHWRHPDLVEDDKSDADDDDRVFRRGYTYIEGKKCARF